MDVSVATIRCARVVVKRDASAVTIQLAKDAVSQVDVNAAMIPTAKDVVRTVVASAAPILIVRDVVKLAASVAIIRSVQDAVEQKHVDVHVVQILTVLDVVPQDASVVLTLTAKDVAHGLPRRCCRSRAG